MKIIKQRHNKKYENNKTERIGGIAFVSMLENMKNVFGMYYIGLFWILTSFSYEKLFYMQNIRI